ncbi:5-methylthioadenosine/S-adenosylhomocysteine deaminase [Candidatus Hydrogenisulfobacillus filiaventi]|uniref:5-methylthioadenosine/S-adenosylhomocysteine deaminase n=1 Tax=Candidatus Hydrogenisulfobacillus filiaventi TaxID=2707344 RepID=A0A6F8ZGH4_9FIRM|nr:5-methylthioadenosine/S-adenosylhomocysteine deaminase [Candidatus Hydrogenisulfobacillus filiaventi]
MRRQLEARAVLTLDAGDRVFAPGRIVWEGDRILAVGPAGDPPDPDAERLVLPEAVVLPGLLNAHNHAAMALLRGYADDSALMPWLRDHIWPVESRLTAEDIYWGTLLAAAEMIRGGTVGFADMYFEVDAVAAAVERSGLRGWIARGLIEAEDPQRRKLAESVEFAARWGGPEHPLITPMLGPHAPYTCSPEYLQAVGEAARRYGLGVHIHLAESREEVAELAARYGQRPFALARGAGLFEVPRCVIAHGVQLTPEDLPALAGLTGGLVPCPVSNAKLGNGIFPYALARDAGLAVGLGTDGPASTNRLDLFTEMRAMAWFQKLAQGRPESFGAREALHLATVGSAAVLGHDGGVLEPGRPADFIAVDLEASPTTPEHDLVSNLVYALDRAQVRWVVVAGRPLLADGRILTFDEAEVRREAARRAARLVQA